MTLLLVAASLLGVPLMAVAADDSTEGPTVSTQEPLVVATKLSPPFSYKDAGGRWTGISIELWKHVAAELGLRYEFREESLEDLLANLQAGRIDAAVAAISVTADRQQRLEFCHPHFTTGLGIAVATGNHAGVFQLLRRVVTPRLLSLVGLMLGIVAVCGVMLWWFERNVNQTTFGGKRRKGIEAGLWWSMILLLGHKGIFPVSGAGRLVAGAAMIASLLLLSLLTGVITSVLTVQQLGVGIDDPSDLRSKRVVTVAKSTAANYLRSRRIAFRTRDSVEAALEAVERGEADAAVYDKPLLAHLANDRFASTIQVLPVSFNTQEYAIALPPESPLRKPINTAVLRFRASDAWEEMIYRYLGEQ
ncbi:transporter substrate-binding domain-containing protein [Botrimarina colliarenosi]|uniref:transporter substrate-binding domain-containing protein n=1 Tax=Botrimarina colliarenosi TaxID=2528001 RepID=UPI0018D367DD|nr:transporter substrate-binding domain-containing protein [Botrimarina colliarenosi]